MQIKKIEELEESIEKLTEELQDTESSRDTLSDEVDELRIDNTMLEEFREDKEELVERSFNAGYEARENNEPQLKAWLNHKIGERI